MSIVDQLKTIEELLRNYPFHSNAIGNAIGTLVGGLLLSVALYVVGNYVARRPRIAGIWALDVTTKQTKYNLFRGMKVRYKLVLVQTNDAISGTAEKVSEESLSMGAASYTGSTRERSNLVGSIEKNYLGRSRISLHIAHQGQERESTSLALLQCTGWGKKVRLIGAYAHTAADSYGTAIATRVPVPNVVDEYRGPPLKWVGRLVQTLCCHLYLAEWNDLHTQLVKQTRRLAVESISANLSLPIAALVLAEDRRFYRHGGIDPIGVARAIWSTIFHGRLQGASVSSPEM